MSLVDWSQVPTGLTVSALVRACEWGIEQVYQSTRKRRGQSDKWRSRARILLRESAKLGVTASVVVIALTSVQSSVWTNPKHLANHLTKRQTTLLAESALTLGESSPQLLAYITEHSGEAFSGPMSQLFADNQQLVFLGLIEEGQIREGEETLPGMRQKAHTATYPSKLTPLGTKVLYEKLHIPLRTKKEAR